VRDLVATPGHPGLTVATAGWFHDTTWPPAIDNVVLEVYPCESDDLFLPVHLLHLVEMGMTQGQNWFSTNWPTPVRRRPYSSCWTPHRCRSRGGWAHGQPVALR